MFVGHYAVALVLVALVPEVDPVVALVSVGLPDLLLGVLVALGVEDVSREAASPLWVDIEFEDCRFSHSLVLGSALWILTAIPLAVVAGLEAGIVLVVGAGSHWVLDVVVHDEDLPVVGLGDDRYVGLGLWRAPAISFFLEYLLYAAATLLFVPGDQWPLVLATGAALHLLTANASFGLARTNPIYDAVVSRIAPRFGTDDPRVVERLFAIHVVAGYAAMTVALWIVFGG